MKTLATVGAIILLWFTVSLIVGVVVGKFIKWGGE